MDEQLLKRLKSFGWGLINTCMVAVGLAGLNYITEYAPDLGLPEFVTVLIVLVTQQLSKHLNTKK